MKEIPLTKGLVSLVDDEDYEFLSQWKWYPSVPKGSRTAYAIRYVPRNEPLDQAKQSMHRLILQARPGQMIDHADHNGLNNTRANLRFCTWAQNSSNSPIPVSAYGYRGISPSANKWRARIRVDGKLIRVGLYNTREEAARAYDAAATAHYEEFATLNFPHEWGRSIAA